MPDKQAAAARIDRCRTEAVERGRRLFDCPEPGFREFATADLICRELDAWGVPCRRDVALTGVAATLGEIGYHVAVVADMDALPRRDGTGFIHSCGHSIQVANALTVLQALLPEARAGTLGGRVSFFFTPAEELTDPEYRRELMAAGKIAGRSGKQDMIAKGWFDGVDCVLSCHASGDGRYRFDVDSVLTGFLLKHVRFLGRPAHSGGAPHLGRNALHGAVLAENAISFLKDQFPPESAVRIHPVISRVGGGVNIIPEEAVLDSYVRAADREALLLAGRRFDDCVQGAALALDLGAEVRTDPGYLPLNQSGELCRLVEQNMLAFCRPEEICRHPLSGASGDIGDVGALLPTIQFGFSGVEGVFHSDSFSVADEEHCYITAAKVLAMTVVDLLNHPGPAAPREEFSQRKQNYLAQWLGGGDASAERMHTL